MAKVTIDGVEYERDTLSEESQHNLDMLMMNDQMIRQLLSELAMLQTAREAYAAALKASLVAPATPEAGLGETFKF
jgi:hypothetical protein